MRWLADYTGDIPGAKGYLRYDPDEGKAYWVRSPEVYWKFNDKHCDYMWTVKEHGYINDPTKFILLCPQVMMETMT